MDEFVDGISELRTIFAGVAEPRFVADLVESDKGLFIEVESFWRHVRGKKWDDVSFSNRTFEDDLLAYVYIKREYMFYYLPALIRHVALGRVSENVTSQVLERCSEIKNLSHWEKSLTEVLLNVSERAHGVRNYLTIRSDLMGPSGEP